MRLNDMDFAKLLPAFMRDDLAVKGLSGGVEEVVRILAEAVAAFAEWDTISTMSGEELDALADELGIDWYRKSADIETRRTLVLESDLVWQRLGTKWSCENVIQTYFGDGNIREWFEYNGQPGHFRVMTNNPTITQDRFEEFLNILEKVKRTSAHLDGVYITMLNLMNLYHGFAYHDTTHEVHRIGADIII